MKPYKNQSCFYNLNLPLVFPIIIHIQESAGESFLVKVSVVYQKLILDVGYTWMGINSE